MVYTINEELTSLINSKFCKQMTKSHAFIYLTSDLGIHSEYINRNGGERNSKLFCVERKV